MAVTVSRYNHTAQKLRDLSFTAEAANFYFELVNGTTPFDATHTTKAQVDNSGADEVSGNGWTAGGENLTSVDVTIVNTNDAMIDAADIVVTATGGSISATDGFIYVDEGGLGSTLTPLWYYDFGETLTATDGNNFTVAFNANGISRGGVA
jgi:hypothetical protein